MSRLESMFEVRVRNNGFLGMKHVEARDHRQARVKGKKYGHVVSVRRTHPERLFGDIEKLDLKQRPLVEYVQDSPYTTAIAMGEMIWQKRNKRINNRWKDKKDIDK